MRVYVDVTARFDKEGNMTPMSIVWENGKIYEIDRVFNVCRCTTDSHYLMGSKRYLVGIGKVKTALYFENSAWFVERKK